MSKHFTKFEDDIVSAISLTELLEIKKQIEDTHLTDEQYERLMKLIESTITDFQ